MSHPRHRRSRSSFRATAGLVSALVMALAVTLTPSALAGSPRAQVVWRGPSTHKTIALTFDDGWDADRCLAITRPLIAARVPATWFPNGVYVRRAPAVWRSIGARFSIGNHTTHHLSLPTLSAKEARRRFDHNEHILEKMTGRPMAKLLRPPYGASDKDVERIAADLGYDRIVLWDASDADSSARITVRSAARAALRGGPGSMILMHCGPAVTPAMLPIVIARYACAGYRFATVDELLAGGPGRRARVHCPAPPLPEPATRKHRRAPDPGASEPPMPDMASPSPPHRWPRPRPRPRLRPPRRHHVRPGPPRRSRRPPDRGSSRCSPMTRARCRLGGPRCTRGCWFAAPASSAAGRPPHRGSPRPVGDRDVRAVRGRAPGGQLPRCRGPSLPGCAPWGHGRRRGRHPPLAP